MRSWQSSQIQRWTPPTPTKNGPTWLTVEPHS